MRRHAACPPWDGKLIVPEYQLNPMWHVALFCSTSKHQKRCDINATCCESAVAGVCSGECCAYLETLSRRRSSSVCRLEIDPCAIGSLQRINVIQFNIYPRPNCLHGDVTSVSLLYSIYVSRLSFTLWHIMHLSCGVRLRGNLYKMYAVTYIYTQQNKVFYCSLKCVLHFV